MSVGDQLIVALGACLVVGGLVPVAMRIALRSLGRRTRGTVVAFTEYADSSGAPARACVVAYSVDGESHRVRAGWSAGGSLRVGDERTVLYWPRAPHRGHLDDATSWIMPLVLSLAGVVLAGTALGFGWV